MLEDGFGKEFHDVAYTYIASVVSPDSFCGIETESLSEGKSYYHI